MSVEMKLGRWEARDGSAWNVVQHNERLNTWTADCGRFWFGHGDFYYDGEESPYDLVRYLGPLELSPTTACAEAGPAGDLSTVSTETAGEQLKRMKQREAAIWRELEIYLPIVDALKAAASDLDEAIKRLENGVEEQASEDHEAAACAVIQDERRER